MDSFKELIKAFQNNEPLYWNDPDSIEDNDYKITSVNVEELHDVDDYSFPISIQYNGGLSEAEVYLHEISSIYYLSNLKRCHWHWMVKYWSIRISEKIKPEK